MPASGGRHRRTARPLEADLLRADIDAHGAVLAEHHLALPGFVTRYSERLRFSIMICRACGGKPAAAGLLAGSAAGPEPGTAANWRAR